MKKYHTGKQKRRKVSVSVSNRIARDSTQDVQCCYRHWNLCQSSLLSPESFAADSLEPFGVAVVIKCGNIQQL